MPLQLPNLDDRSYSDLLAEALTLIPAYSPEWTNFNPSDPGITLVELFAYLTDLLLYRLNRVTDDNTRKFLQLLNGPDWTEPRNADLRDEIRQAVLGIRERYRAVTADDYEFLSTASFNQWVSESQPSLSPVARAHCVPQRNLDAGTEADRLARRPEHVSVVIVPLAGQGGSANPQPAADLIDALLSFLDERRMLTTKLHVTGPFYAHVSAQLVIARNPDGADAAVTAAIDAALTALLNPLPSANAGGWPFGRDVFVSQVYETLESIPGIDYITDVMLNTSCDPSDTHCVVADQIWHAGGDLVGLRVQDHHLPVFAGAAIVIAPDSDFITVNVSVSAKAAPTADPALLNRLIKSTVRGLFHPGLGGPGPGTAGPVNIFLADLQVAIGKIAGLLDPVTLTVDCIPSQSLQQDKDRGAFIQAGAGNVLDWSVTIQLT